MISYLVGESATAYYSVAYSVSAVITIVWSAVNSSLIPFTYENLKKGNFTNIKKVSTAIAFCFTGLIIIAIMLAPEIVSLMAPQEYKEAIYVIPCVIAGVFFQIQYYLYANVIYYYKKPKYVMYSSVFSMLLNLVLNYYLIKQYGYFAAGFTTLLCYLSQAILDLLAYKKVIQSEIYDLRILEALSIFVVIVSIASIFCYRHVLLRYIIIICLFVVFYIFRKRIIKMFKIRNEDLQ